MRFMRSMLLMLTLCLCPVQALAESGQSFRLDGAAFVDSLQYMLKGMAGIFLVTALIILALVALEKFTSDKKK